MLELESRFLTGRLPGVSVSTSLASCLRVATLWRTEGVAGFGPSAGSARFANDRFRRLRNDLSVAYEQVKISPRIGRPARFCGGNLLVCIVRFASTWFRGNRPGFNLQRRRFYSNLLKTCLDLNRSMSALACTQQSSPAGLESLPSRLQVTDPRRAIPLSPRPQSQTGTLRHP
jgi:hypothetical protein